MSSEKITASARISGRFAIDNLLGEAFGDGGLAHARIADEQRIVLAAAAQNLDRALDFGIAPDQRVGLALRGPSR